MAGCPRIGPLIALATLAVALSACVERKEVVSVRADGVVEIEVVHTSDSLDDLLEGDAIPDEAAGWAVALEERVSDDGDVSQVYSARIALAPGMPLPERYGPPRDPRSDSTLSFPTTLTVERRPDGTWYHFRRVYEPRRHAELAALRDSPAAQRLQSLGEGLEGQADPVRMEEIARALIDVQAERTLLLARRAFLESAPRAAQDGWLRVRASLHRLAREVDAAPMAHDFAAAMRMPDDSRKAAAVERALRRVEDAVADRLQLAVRAEAGFGGSELSRFLAVLERERTTAAVTEDLGDDSFEISVELPGEIMGSNADDVGGRRATWRFKGEALMDRPRELLVSSRVGG